MKLSSGILKAAIILFLSAVSIFAQPYTFDFDSPLLTGDETASLQQVVQGITVTVTSSSGGNIYLSWGIEGRAVLSYKSLEHDENLIFTFSSAVNISSFQILEFGDVNNGSNYVFTPSSGTVLSIVDNHSDLDGLYTEISPGDWNGITSLTVTYTDASEKWNLGLDEIIFTIPVVNNAPEVDLNGGDAGNDNSASYTIGGGMVRFAPSATITDANSANLVSLTASLSSIPDGTDEGLSLTGDGFGVTGGMSIVYDNSTGVLTCTGSKTVADYQTLLQNLVYYNYKANPDQTNRVITVVLSDGTNNSTARTSTMSLVSPNTAPEVDLNGGDAGNDNSASFSEGSGG